MLKEGLKTWTVLLSGGGGGGPPARLGATAQVKRMDRQWYLHGTSKKALIDSDHYRIKVLINPPDELIDLTDQEKKEARAFDVKDWKASDGIRRGKTTEEPTVPGGRFVRQVRDSAQGLLILYPLLSDDQKAENKDTPILAFVISFPSVDALGDTPVTYIVGNVYQQLEMNLDV